MNFSEWKKKVDETNSTDENVDEWRHHRFQFSATSLQTISMTEGTVLWGVKRCTAADRYS
jgi:hypothetical protein